MIGLTKWKQLSVKPHILPPEADRLLMIQVHTSVTTTKSDKFELPYIPYAAYDNSEIAF